MTALHAAAARGDISICRALVHAGGFVFKQDSDNQYPFDLAYGNISFFPLTLYSRSR